MDIDRLLRAMGPDFDPSAECERLFGRLDDLDTAFADVRATATSPDGLIEVTVGARGELCELVLDPRVYHRPNSSELAAAIVSTAATAARRAAEQVALLVPGALKAGAA